MDHIPKIMSAAYREKLFNLKSFEAVVLSVADKLRDKDFDAIAFCGMSGAMVAPSVAALLSKSMILVRKELEMRERVCHSTREVEGDKAARKYVILDDGISTGTTLKRIRDAIKKWNPEAECGFAIMYSGAWEFNECSEFEGIPILRPSILG